MAVIKYCSKHDILKQFLEKHGSEVLNMILTEWNTEDTITVAREEDLEKGREEVFNLLNQGFSIQ